jgi:probable F420-dependent oxidoreductase
MQIGVVYPQIAMETDPAAVSHFAQAVEEMGYAYVLAYDHVLGANRASRPGKVLPYDIHNTFHEPLVLFAFMAPQTSKLGFVVGVMVLTQRQTALVAKQAACVDVLSQGRLRLGVGTGWNDVEYEALGMDFKTRGARIEEQVAVLRELWTEPAVTFRGADHTVTDAGLNPLPVQRPIPIWFGGGGDRVMFGQTANLKVLRRIARIGDGWLQPAMSPARFSELLEVLHGYCREFGRDPRTLGLESRLEASLAGQDRWADEAQTWRGLGVTDLTINTMTDDLYGVDAHLKRLELCGKVIGLTP